MRVRFLVSLLAGVVSLSSCGSLAVAAATVNGEKIRESEVESEFDVLRAHPVFGEQLKRDYESRGQRRQQILSQLIYQMVMDQEARRLRIRVKEEQADTLIEQRAATEGLSVERFLDAQNLSREEARRLATRAVRQAELMERVLRGVGVDEKAVREVYTGQQERFVEVHLQRITVRTPGDAREALEALEGDASFEDVAREHSIDDLKGRGGDMGYVSLADLDVEVQDAVRRAVEGAFTDPIQAANGIEIYRLVDRRTKPFEEVAEEIRLGLTQTQRDARFEEWLTAKVRAAKIVINPKYGRFDRRATPPSVVPSPGELEP